jgi:hypothetical protein
LKKNILSTKVEDMNKFKSFLVLVVFLAACSPSKNVKLVEFDCSDVAISGMGSLVLSQKFDIDSWVCSIRALDNLEIQQVWYGNLLGQLNLITMRSEELVDVNLWYTIINELTNPEIRQTWYGNLLGQLNLQALGGGDDDLDTMHIIVEELTDKNLQNTWRSNIEGIKTLQLLKGVSN